MNILFNFKKKEKDFEKDFEKVRKSIISCNTLEQLQSASRMYRYLAIKHANRQYRDHMMHLDGMITRQMERLINQSL